MFANPLQTRCVIIVGYQNKAGFAQKRNFVVPTFKALSGNVTLGDIKANNVAWANSYIMFLTPDGTTAKFEHPVTKKTVNKAFYYIGPEEAGTDYEPSWYQYGEDEPTNLMNDLPLDPGEGFQFYVQDAGAELVFAGQVADDVQTFPMGNKRNFTGFALPTAGVLGDITAVNVAWANSYLMFLTPDGTTVKFEHPVTKKTVNKAFYYIGEDEAGTDYEPGWYQYNEDEPTNNMNNLPLAAGEGFQFYGQDTGAALQLPKPY